MMTGRGFCHAQSFYITVIERIRNWLFCDTFSIVLAHMSLPSTLAALPAGRSALIQRVLGSGPVVTRLQELGLVTGTTVRVVRRALTGEPVELEIRGSRIAMRSAEAACFEIQEVQP
jgi:ferrous iron transport protein A